MSPIRSADLVAEFRADTRDFQRGASQVESVVRQIAGVDPTVEVAMDVGQVDAAKSAISGLPTSSSLGIEVDAGKVDAAKSAIGGLPDSAKVVIDVDDSALKSAFSDTKSGAAGAVAGLAGGAGLLAGFSQAVTADAVGAKVRAATAGAVGITEDLGSVAGAVYANAFGESLPEVGEAVTQVAAGLGRFTTGSASEIQGLTENVLTLADVMGTDVGESIGSVQALIVSGLAPNATAALDLIAGGLAKLSGPARDELLSALNEYSIYFANLGLGGADAMSLLTNAVGGGNIAVDKAADAIKEFGIRAIDGSQGTAGAFEQIGLDAREMGNKIAAGGPTAQVAMRKIAQAILGVEDPIIRNQAAVGLFGTQIEDLGGASGLQDLLSAISQESDTFEGSMGAMGDAAYDSFGSVATGAMRTFTEALGSLGQMALPILRPMLDFFVGLPGPIQAVLAGGVALTGVVIALAVALGPMALALVANSAAAGGAGIGFAGMGAAAAGAATGVWAMMAPLLPIVAAIAAVVAVGVLLWQNWDTIKNAAAAVWNFIGDLIGGVVGFIGDRFNDAKRFIGDLIFKFVVFKENIGQIIGNVLGFFGNLVGGIGNAIGAAIGFVTGIPGRILGALGNLGRLLFDAGQNIIQGLIDGVMSMIGRIGDAIGSAVGKIRDFLPFSPAKEGPLSGGGAPIFAGRAISSMLAEGIDAGLPAVASAASRLAGVAATTSSANFTSSTALPAPVAPSPMRVGSATNNDGGTHLHFYGPVVGGEAGMRELARTITGVSEGRTYQAGG